MKVDVEILVVQPAHVVAVVRHAVLNAERLGDETAALFVEAEGNRIGEHRLGREQFDSESAGHADARHGLPRFIGSRGNFWLELIR